MKSLKELSSISQIKEDTLLGITNQPPNTCPLINALIFNSERSSVVYEIDILFNPEDMYLTLHELKDRVAQLQQWAVDVSNLFDDADKDLIPEAHREDMLEYYTDVEERLNHDYLDEVERQATNINKVIKDWETLHESYVEEEKELNEENDQLARFESEFEDLDVDDDDYIDNKYDLEEKIERSKNDIYQIEKSLSKTKTKFENNVERGFADDAAEFSELLERLRSNNDNMRTNTHNLKKELVKFIDKEFNLLQPMAYLKKLETGRDDEISLGLIDKSNVFVNYSRIGQYLLDKGVITQIQRDVIGKTRDIDSLVDMMHSLGYKTVRYYTSEEKYVSNPEIYFEKNIKNKQGNNYNIIPKI
jgi:hypothetical protein